MINIENGKFYDHSALIWCTYIVYEIWGNFQKFYLFGYCSSRAWIWVCIEILGRIGIRKDELKSETLTFRLCVLSSIGQSQKHFVTLFVIWYLL
jgi:hypothetical protein